jgi:DNA primase
MRTSRKKIKKNTFFDVRRKVALGPSRLNTCKAYLEGRGLVSSEIKSNGIGYCEKDRRILFPIKNRDNVLVGCVGRRLFEKDQPKYYKYDSSDDSVLLGEDRLDAACDEVYLVEGPIDLIKTKRAVRNVLCVNGLALTPRQEERLLYFGDRVTLMFDSDRAGKAALLSLGYWRLCKRTRVFVVNLPEGKDPGDLGAQELSQIIKTQKFIL